MYEEFLTDLVSKAENIKEQYLEVQELMKKSLSLRERTKEFEQVLLDIIIKQTKLIDSILDTQSVSTEIICSLVEKINELQGNEPSIPLKFH